MQEQQTAEHGGTENTEARSTPEVAPLPLSRSEINDLASRILKCAVEVHRTLGPGLLECVYEEALICEFELEGIPYDRQRSVSIRYKGRVLSRPLTLDLIVGGVIILEIKATEKHNALYEAQLLTYLRLAGLQIGYVLNFGQHLMKDGIHRVVNG